MSPAWNRWAVGFSILLNVGFPYFASKSKTTEREIEKTPGIEISRLFEEFVRLFVFLIIFQNKHELKITYSFQLVNGNKTSQHVWTKVC